MDIIANTATAQHPQLAASDLELLNRFQRAFPLCPRPFQEIATALGQAEEQVLSTVRRLQEQGAVSRVGAVFAAKALGVSTLAALAVPPAQLEAVAQLVNAYAEVNHNYQREHLFNLWFVLTAASEQRLQTVLAELEATTALPLLNLPLLEQFHIDLAFNLHDGTRLPTPQTTPCVPLTLDALDRRLLAALQPGLPLVAEPYQALANAVDSCVAQVLERLQRYMQHGIIKRLGIIVRHRHLGFRANAMLVFDIPDAAVSAVGDRLAQQNGVNLCYRRPRQLPLWRYNLFSMVHGRKRAPVLERIEQLRTACALHPYPYAVLFSQRCFRQRGAYYLPLPDDA